MNKFVVTALALITAAFSSFGQTIEWEGQELKLSHVNASIVTLKGETVLKVERDLKSLPFDIENLAKTVDEPTYVELKGLKFENGVFEVKMLSRIQTPSPFPMAQGFIGVAFRVNESNSAFESIYLRPRVGRSDNPATRNHTVQYFAYPDYKFDRLRKESNGEFETHADVGLDEWITMRIEVSGRKAALYLNGQKQPTLVVNEMKGKEVAGSIGLWVDIGTEGYFKDFKIISAAE